LGKLFVAAGNKELSKNIASYTTDQKVFVIKTFTFLVVLVLLGRQYRPEICVRVAPSRDIICWIIKQSEETGSVCVCV
jgi:hypothetical protein